MNLRAHRMESFNQCLGTWHGTNHLWVYPGEPVRESESTLVVAKAARDLFQSFAYTWTEKGIPQEGLLIVGREKESGIVRAVWIDSWHMQDKLMICEGAETPAGGFTVKGSYAAPPDPDWGWRITVEPREVGRIRLTMHNITPQGEETLAVETLYERQVNQ